MSQKDIVIIKPLSRFVEHFDMMLPTELLDMIGEEDEKQQQQQQQPTTTGKSKKPTPLYALPGFNKHPSSSTISINSSPEERSNVAAYSPTAIYASSISPTSPGGRNYLDRNSPKIATRVIVSEAPPPAFVRSQSSHPVSTPNNTNETIIINKDMTKTDSIAVMKENKSSGLSHNTQQQQQQEIQYNNNSSSTTTTTTSNSIGGNTKKILGNLRSLNRADIIIKRYESWNQFITLLSSWISEIARLSIQSERSYQTLLRDNKFSNLKASDIGSANGIHATIHGFTMDLASQEQKFGRFLQTEHIPILEKYKKECTYNIKKLKTRPDLGLEEFLKRAEVTASLILQLTKTCKEARRTIEKGAQVTNDPWLVNLYVLRQLKREVDEENRLRKLMVPIQRTMIYFETRLLKSVENALKVCFEKPGALNESQLSSIQSSLNQAVANNWNAFASMNKKDIVNENNPLKRYLNINYSCKNDPLVMTLYKGQLERRSGVLNKYTQRFFVLTESGFLHQFKLNDKVSPENSIYLPKSTIIPCMDISPLNVSNLLVQEQQLQKPPKEGYNFEIQRSGSVLQRDKLYVFRTFRLEEMITWCRMFSEVATRPPESVIQNILKPMQLSETTSTNSLTLSDSYNQQEEQQQQQLQQQHFQQQQPESTPPPSPIDIRENRKSILSIVDSKPNEEPIVVNEIEQPSVDNNLNGKPKLYTALLNI